jgi:hypothetical protein
VDPIPVEPTAEGITKHKNLVRFFFKKIPLISGKYCKKKALNERRVFQYMEVFAPKGISLVRAICFK